jgi:hypothetical protein
MSAFGTLPTDRRRSLILDLVAKYTYKILSANVGFVGSPAIRILTDSINKYQKSDQYIQLGLRPLIAQTRLSVY